MKHFCGAVALLFLASTAGAQVGHMPDRSPYRDIEGGQELGIFAGHFNSLTDALGVLPKPGPVAGLLYQVHVGGPVGFIVRYGQSRTSRMAVNPLLGKASRSLGSHNVTVSMVDVSMGFNLTGMRSYHHIVPVMSVGGGLVSCSCSVATDPFDFGTPFALSLGTGLRYMPGGHFQIRVDVNDYLYQGHYPGAYYVNSADNTPVAEQGTARSFWKNNPTLTIGVSHLFFR